MGHSATKTIAIQKAILPYCKAGFLNVLNSKYARVTKKRINDIQQISPSQYLLESSSWSLPKEVEP
jgi:hypothetical protein